MTPQPNHNHWGGPVFDLYSRLPRQGCQAGGVAVVLLDDGIEIESGQLALVDDEAAIDDGVAGGRGSTEDDRGDRVGQGAEYSTRLRSRVKKSAHLPTASEPMSVRPRTAAPPMVAISRA